jgi:hypothetical protein
MTIVWDLGHDTHGWRLTAERHGVLRGFGLLSDADLDALQDTLHRGRILAGRSSSPPAPADAAPFLELLDAYRDLVAELVRLGRGGALLDRTTAAALVLAVRGADLVALRELTTVLRSRPLPGGPSS